MKNLIRKELKLVVQPINYIFLLFGAMVLIPNYPYLVSFFYPTLGIFLMMMTTRENDDLVFSAMLPVRKSDVVRARFITVSLIEIANILATIPFVLLRGVLYKGSEVAENFFLMPNAVFFGLAFIVFAAFNASFLPKFFKNGYDLRFLIPAIVVFLVINFAEVLGFVPVVRDYIRATDLSGQLAQLPVLLGGIAVFALELVLDCRRSIKYFEKVNL